jgi:hypothetical protein
LFGKQTFPGMFRPIELAPICLSFEGVAVHARIKVLMEFEENILLIAENSQGILIEHLRPQQFTYNFSLFTKLY